MKIIEVNELTNGYLNAIRRMISSLSTEYHPFTEADFRELLTSGNSHLFFLMDGECVAGMLSVGIYRSPTGTKAWIEDVVVDEVYRGRGLGKLLIRHAIDFVKSQHADLLMLTSNPSRTVANHLYQAIGFERKETNVYRMKL
jgi:ribosomal protein S18 acetylase RimI-like enzyme